MDRMHYRGPKWEGVGVPKSILEEFDPRYRKVDAEEHPSKMHPEKEGKKDFEYVVRWKQIILHEIKQREVVMI